MLSLPHCFGPYFSIVIFFRENLVNSFPPELLITTLCRSLSHVPPVTTSVLTVTNNFQLTSVRVRDLFNHTLKSLFQFNRREKNRNIMGQVYLKHFPWRNFFIEMKPSKCQSKELNSGARKVKEEGRLESK